MAERGQVPGKSMVPLLSASTSLIMSWSSDSEGFWPRDRMTVPSSLVVICPSHGLERVLKPAMVCAWARCVEGGQKKRAGRRIVVMLRGKLTIAILVLLLTTQLAARPLIARGWNAESRQTTRVGSGGSLQRGRTPP